MTESVTEAIHKAVRAAGPATGKASQSERSPEVSIEERRQMIAEAAYYRAEQRGFSNEDSSEHDWLLAEQEIDALLASRKPGGKTPRAH